MQDEVIATPRLHKRVPWNKGKLTGANLAPSKICDDHQPAAVLPRGLGCEDN